MSFNTDVKNELARIRASRRDCRFAELSAIVHLDGSMHILGTEQYSFSTVTENAAVARKTYSLISELFKVNPEIRVWEKQRLQKGNAYEIYVAPQAGIMQVLNEIGVLDDQLRFAYGIAGRLVKRSCCAVAYLRGAFLAAGAVSDPKRAYHFEITVGSEEMGRDLARLLERFSLSPRITARKKNFAVYLKESESIVSFLALVGAYQTLFAWLDAKMLHEVRNEVNRLINCDTANLRRAVEAAHNQLADIGLIEEVFGLHNLPKKLQEIALLRLDNPEATISELGEMSSPKLTKSAVNHRLRRLHHQAESLRETD